MVQSNRDFTNIYTFYHCKKNGTVTNKGDVVEILYQAKVLRLNDEQGDDIIAESEVVKDGYSGTILSL